MNEAVRKTLNFTLFSLGPDVGSAFVSALPLILSPLHNVTINVGKRLVLTCNTSGDPAAQVSWTKNEVGLPARARLDLGNSTLVIDNVEFADDGEYKCTATNRQGNVSSSAIVEVQGKVCHMSEFAWFM